MADGRTDEPTAAPPAAEAAQAARPGGVGGVRIVAPVGLDVFRDGTLVGSSAGPIALPEGVHTLLVSSEPLDYRDEQTVTVKAGQLTELTIALPMGRMNINAVPWASVSIDGRPAGDTPLANIEVPIGAHEILFSHPDLGEQRLSAVVKAGAVTRVSASLRR
jgi:hypothetical protein